MVMMSHDAARKSRIRSTTSGGTSLPVQSRIAPAAYYTVTSATPQPTGAAVRAVFAPNVTLSDLQRLLDDAHLKIVAGPTEAGVYSLAMTGSAPVEWSLQRLRAHEAVRFAESIGAASAGPSQ